KNQVFDAYSQEYDDWFDSHPDVYLAELEAVRQLIPPGEAKGLEVGIGSGKFAFPLGIKFGVEPSASMAKRARELGITVFDGAAEQLPSPDGSFDYVLMVTTICFVDDVPQSFREARRVLKPGGYLIIGLVDKESEIGRHYVKVKDKDKFYRDATFYSSAEVVSFLQQANFTDIIAKQTLIPGKETGCIQDGYGEGSFVVIRGCKSGAGS
ncbi:MAG: class I SAM-dependent methyltransferase, partial [Anaerolineae bacterium]